MFVSTKSIVNRANIGDVCQMLVRFLPDITIINSYDYLWINPSVDTPAQFLINASRNSSTVTRFSFLELPNLARYYVFSILVPFVNTEETCSMVINSHSDSEGPTEDEED